ncbi:MAG: DUF2612 domain-containing protein [Shewanella sp.]
MTPTLKQDMTLSLALNQMTESPNYLSIIRAIARTYDDQDAVLEYIGKLDVYTARGVWLDLIGSIVGAARRVDIGLKYTYFGYSNLDSVAAGYGKGRYWHYGAPSSASNLLGDEEYRRVILAKAAQNAGDCSHISVVEVMQKVLDTSKVFSFNGGNGNLDIMFEGAISDNMLALIKSGKIIPTSAGVGLRLLLQYDSSKSFGYTNLNAKAKGYGVGSYPRRIN